MWERKIQSAKAHVVLAQNASPGGKKGFGPFFPLPLFEPCGHLCLPVFIKAKRRSAVKKLKSLAASFNASLAIGIGRTAGVKAATSTLPMPCNDLCSYPLELEKASEKSRFHALQTEFSVFKMIKTVCFSKITYRQLGFNLVQKLRNRTFDTTKKLPSDLCLSELVLELEVEEVSLYPDCFEKMG